MAKAPEVKSADRETHDRLRSAVERNVVTIYTDPARLNTVGSPVFDPWENTLPLLAGLLLSLFLLVGVDMIIGVIALLVVVALYLFAARPWVVANVRHRATLMTLRDAETLDTLWAFGGLALTRTDQPAVGALAPTGNWRLFVRRHLPEVALVDDLTQSMADTKK